MPTMIHHNLSSVHASPSIIVNWGLLRTNYPDDRKTPRVVDDVYKNTQTLRTTAANTLPSLHHYRSSWRGKPRPETPTRQRAENSATYDRQGKWLQRSARAGTRDFHHDTTRVYSAVTRSSSSSNYSELRDIQQQSALDRHTDRQAGIQTSIDTSGEAIQYSVMRHSNTHTYEQTE